jgi:hypothetical protein
VNPLTSTAEGVGTFVTFPPCYCGHRPASPRLWVGVVFVFVFGIYPSWSQYLSNTKWLLPTLGATLTCCTDDTGTPLLPAADLALPSCRDTQTRRHPLVNLTIALHEKPSAGRLSFLTTRVRADTSGTACHRAGKREGSPRCGLRELDPVSARRSLCLTLYLLLSRLSFGVIAGDWDCRLFHESPRRAVRPSM